MRRLFPAFAVLAVACLAVIPLLSEPASAQTAAPTGVPTSEASCRHSGWRTVTDPVGAHFGSRAACLRWVRAHPGGHLGLADVTGVFTGVESFTFACTFVHQTFDATYPTPVKSRVGPATLAIEGCVDNPITSFVGTFSITTSSGTVSGTVAGTISSATGPAIFRLDLTTTGATGLFAGATGDLHVDIQWAGFPETAISGTVAQPPPV
jgi:hypothetical protein